MSSLDKKIGTLRSRIRRLVLVYGLSWSVGGTVGVVLLLGLIDYMIRFRDPGMRVICSLAVLTVLICSFYRHLYLGLKLKLHAVDLAKRLQRRFPELGDSLASAVEFQGQREDDSTAGSAELRRAVIARATADADPLDFSEVIDVGPTRRAVVIAATVCLVAAIAVVWSPTNARTAVARLANPFGNTTWPQKTHLVLRKSVSRVARGQAFEVEVIDRFGARLPDDVRIHYRFDEQGRDWVAEDGAAETELMRSRGDAMVATRENVSRPFEYRVEGGDDQSMEWRRVEVVEPPEIESLSIELTPPAYTGWPVEFVDKHIRVLSGTRMRCMAKSNKLLRSVELCLEDERSFAGQLMSDGLCFVVPPEEKRAIGLTKSTSYWFKLTDRVAIVGGDDVHWDIRVVADQPPSVTIERPGDTSFVTPKAIVPVRVSAKDDLAIRSVILCVGPDKKKCELSLPLYVGPNRVKKLSTGGLSDGGELGENRVVDYRWELGRLKLKSGTQTSFYVTATDYFGNKGKSESRLLVIITPQELADRIVGRQTAIVTELTRILQTQRRAKSQVNEQEVRLRELGHLDQIDLDHLRGAELNQRQVGRALAGRMEGVPMHILRLLADLKNNRVDSPDVRRRMTDLLAELDRLAAEDLPVINRELTATIKDAQVWLRDESQGKIESEPLANAGRHQGRVIAAIEQMLRKLAEWDSYRRFHREIGLLLREQEELGARTVKLGRRTLGRDVKALQSTEVADLKVLARRQLELARRLERIMQKMGSAAKKLKDVDLLSAETVLDALRRARQLAINGRMRSAGNDVARNRVGQAVAWQKKVVEDLKEILDILAKRREHKPARPKDELRPAGADVEQPRASSGDGKKSSNAGVAQTGRATVGKPDMEEMHELLRRLWGELPSKARERMLELPVEQFLPKYEIMIEDYFKQLSKEKVSQ